MTLSEQMERDLRSIMRQLRAYGTVEVYLRRNKQSGVLRITTEGTDSQRVAGYAMNHYASYEDVADMIREDVAHEVAGLCRKA
jgi:hypothetical protein